MNMLLWGAETRTAHIPVFEGLASAGFDGVEISVVGQSSSQLKLMREAVLGLGLELTASTFIPADVNPIATDPATRRKALDYLRARIDDAATLGSELLVGAVYQAHKVFSGRGPTDQEWEWSRQYLRAAGEHAADAGVRLGLEFLNRFEVYLINTAADAALMCRDVGLDNVGVLYDTHHAHIEDPDPVIALPAAGDHLFHIHLSESHRGTLGSGQVNWDETFATLDFLGYSGWLTIEAFGMSDPAIVGAANIWRQAFDSEEQLYRDGLRFIREHLRAVTN